jgi:hypothetical protein
VSANMSVVETVNRFMSYQAPHDLCQLPMTQRGGTMPRQMDEQPGGDAWWCSPSPETRRTFKQAIGAQAARQ